MRASSFIAGWEEERLHGHRSLLPSKTMAEYQSVFDDVCDGGGASGGIAEPEKVAAADGDVHEEEN